MYCNFHAEYFIEKKFNAAIYFLPVVLQIVQNIWRFKADQDFFWHILYSNQDHSLSACVCVCCVHLVIDDVCVPSGIQPVSQNDFQRIGFFLNT